MKVVLHICCGVCAGAAAERLAREGRQVSGLFYNPNIYPAREYKKRLEVAKRVAKELGFPLAAAAYTPEAWFEATRSLENEPEGGRRCEVCFRLRLERTYQYMKDCGADAFATTLTISPHKSAAVVNRVGWEVGGDSFLERDFKKQEGFKRAIELAKTWALYRQDYCGCMYSLRDRQLVRNLSPGRPNSKEEAKGGSDHACDC
ncbi:MAG: epoxyqueuosine reductase QueH [Chloroflexota bacterium]|nr:epoxyqueuosine reductase QueH [Chloroflexota bacterium]